MCMNGFNLEKFIIDLNNSFDCTNADFIADKIKRALSNQNLEIKDNKIVEKKFLFEVGDWIVAKSGESFTDGNLLAKIVDYKDGYYWLTTKRRLCRYSLENYFRKWTIKDAKPGDILTCDYSSPFSVPFIAIFKEYTGDNTFESYCFQNFEGEFYKGSAHNTSGIHPATLEEEKQLFSLIEKEGFLWDSKKLKLYREVRV